MVKGKLIRTASVAVASVGLLAATSGIAGASAGTISTTGYQSYNAVISKNSSNVTTKTHTNLLVGSANVQGSYSGDAKATKNTTGGSVTTGDSSNNNTTKTDVMVMNPTPAAPVMMTGNGGGTGSIDTTGADSTNKVVSVNKSDVKTETTTNIGVLSYSQQQSSTGDASASKNTTTGNVMTGNSSNTNSTSTTITVQQ